jgi:molybdopterin converting factor small subunit
LDVEVVEGSTVGDLLDQVMRNTLRCGRTTKSILIGAGVDFVDRNYKLKSGEEIAVMPPGRADESRSRRSEVSNQTMSVLSA